MNDGNRAEVHPGIDHCPRCRLPAHASETNDDGVCAACLGDEAVRPGEHGPGLDGYEDADQDADAFCADEGAWRPGDGFAGYGADVEQRFDFGGGDA